MKAPVCKICGEAHWLTQPHAGQPDRGVYRGWNLNALVNTPPLKPILMGVTKSSVTKPVTKSAGRGRPKIEGVVTAATERKRRQRARATA